MIIARTIVALALVLGVGVPAGSVRGDTVILKNGDVLNGDVLSLDAGELKLKSSVLGQVSLARENVVTIHFGDGPRPAASAAPNAGTPLPPTPAGAATAPSIGPEGVELPKADSVGDVVRQLQLGGVDAGTLKGLQDKLPLLATPEAKGYFDEKVRGLMAGNLTIQDIRKDAINARDQLRDLQRELGPQADDALGPYMSILEAFIRRTEPTEPIRPSGGDPADDSDAKPNDTPDEP